MAKSLLQLVYSQAFFSIFLLLKSLCHKGRITQAGVVLAEVGQVIPELRCSWHGQENLASSAVGSNLSNLDEFATAILLNLNNSSDSRSS